MTQGKEEHEVLTPAELARLIRVTVGTLARWRRDGSGPPWSRVGRGIRYPREGVAAWMTTGGVAA